MNLNRLVEHDKRVTSQRQAKQDRKKAAVDEPGSSEDESVHLLVESLPKLEVNPSNVRGSKITIKPPISSQLSITKSRAETAKMRASHNSNLKTIKINKESHHTRKTSENIQKSSFTIRTNPKTSQLRSRQSSKLTQKNTFELVESQVVASDIKRAQKNKKAISIDIALRKSLFGENGAKSKAPGAFRLASQFYGPTNLLEVRDKRTKELLSFSFLTRGHLVV